MTQPLTLKLLKESGKYYPRALERYVKDDLTPFTPEQMQEWGIPSEDIVQVVAIYLQQTGKEYNTRLMLAEILEPCAEIYAKYEPKKPNVVREVIELLEEKIVDAGKIATTGVAVFKIRTDIEIEANKNFDREVAAETAMILAGNISKIRQFRQLESIRRNRNFCVNAIKEAIDSTDSAVMLDAKGAAMHAVGSYYWRQYNCIASDHARMYFWEQAKTLHIKIAIKFFNDKFPIETKKQPEIKSTSLDCLNTTLQETNKLLNELLSKFK